MLTYFEDLDGGFDPAGDTFTVEADGSPGPTVSSADADGKTVTLTLASAVTSAQTVTVSYDMPASNAVRDDSGLAGPSFADLAVVNNTGNSPATGAPTISGTAKDGEVLTAHTGGISDLDGKTKADNGELDFAYTYQWFTADANIQGGVQNKQSIAGAILGTYTVTADEVDRRIGVEVRFKDDADHAEGPLESAVTDVVAPRTTTPTLPTLRFASANYTASEGTGGTVVTVRLEPAAGSAVTVSLTATNRGGATAADYSGVPSSVTFAAGQTAATFTVTATDDGDDDDGESVLLGFGQLPSGVEAGRPSTATVELVDDDAGSEPLTVSFGAAEYTATEGGRAATVAVQLNRLPAWSFGVRLAVAREGGASMDDHSTVPSFVGHFNGSKRRITFKVSATNDKFDDDGESIVIRFGHPLVVGSLGSPLEIGSPSETRVWLVDNDDPVADGDLRLARGTSDWGVLQVYHDDRWGLVCDSRFDDKDAKVACRQLGFVDGEKAYGGAGTRGLPFWLSGLECVGNESRLLDCPGADLRRYHCGAWDLAGVECSHTSLSIADASVAGALLTVRFTAPLDGFWLPDGDDFVVLAGPAGAERELPVTAVAADGAELRLRLADPAGPGEPVLLSYLAGAMHPLQGADGGGAAPPADVAVRNETGPGRAASEGPEAVDADAAPAPGNLPLPPARYAAPPAVLTADAIAAARSGRARLDLSSLGLADIAALAGGADVLELKLGGNALADAGALAGRAELRILDLSDNRLEHARALSGLTGLRRLDLSGNRIADLWPLAGLTGLERLDLSGNRVEDVAALAGLANLKVLLLDGNAVSDVLPVSLLPALARLGLAGNRVADVVPLGELAALRRLDLSGNAVADVSPLGDLSGLVWLRLPGNPVADSAPLGRLTRLRWLWMDGTLPADLLRSDADGPAPRRFEGRGRR